MKKAALFIISAAACLATFLGLKEWRSLSESTMQKFEAALHDRAMRGSREDVLEFIKYWDEKNGVKYIDHRLPTLAKIYRPASEYYESLINRLARDAEKGDTNAAYTLAMQYADETSAYFNPEMAVKTMEFAAENGNPSANSVLPKWSTCVGFEDFYKPGFDEETKLEYLEKAAELGDISSGYKVAAAYLAGGKKDIPKAKKYLAKVLLYKPKDNSAHYDLLKLGAGYAYANGLAGDDMKAEGAKIIDKIYNCAMAQPDDQMCACLYIMNKEGIGIAPNEEKAAAIYKKYISSEKYANYKFFSWMEHIYGQKILQIPEFDNIAIENEAERLKWKETAIKANDPFAIFEKKCSELFGKANGSLFPFAFYIDSINFSSAEKREKVGELLQYYLAAHNFISENPDFQHISASWVFSDDNLAKIYLGLGMYADAEKLIKSIFLDKIPIHKARLAAMAKVFGDKGLIFGSDTKTLEKIDSIAKRLYEKDYYKHIAKLLSSNGRLYGFTPNIQESEKFYYMALELGADVDHELLNLYPGNAQKAAETAEKIESMRKSAPNPQNLYLTGVSYFNSGHPEKALPYFKRSSKGNLPEAISALFYMYSTGTGVSPNSAKADLLEDRLMSIPKEDALNAIKNILPTRNNSSNYYIKTHRDFTKGIEIARKLIDIGYTNLIDITAQAYLCSDLPDKCKTAEEILLKTPTDNRIAYTLTRLYEGDFGDEIKDLDKAIKWEKVYIAELEAEAFEHIASEYIRLTNLHVKNGDYKSAFETAMKYPDDPILAMFISECYETGKGVGKDPVKAKQFMDTALNEHNEANKLNTLANVMGHSYYAMFEHNPEKRRKIYELAVSRGGYVSRLAQMLAKGEGGPKDIARAVSLLEKGTKNNPSSLISLAKIYLELDEPQSLEKAFEYFDRGMSLMGSSASPLNCVMFGALYLNGWGTARNPEKAFEYFQKAIDAEICDIFAFEANAYCYENGIGTTKNLKKAEELRKQAESFDAEQLARVGNAYSWMRPTYKWIFHKDLERARHWYGLAAAKGHKTASEMLAKIDRKFPPFTDREKAIIKANALSKLAAAGDEEADVELSMMYIEGKEIEGNPAAGLIRLKNGAAKGNVEAAKKIKELFADWKKKAEKKEKQ